MRNITASTRVLNALLKPTVAGQRTPEHVFQLLIDKAERSCGGSAEGDEDFLDGCRRLLDAYSRVEDMTATGWQTALADLQVRVQNRMRVRRLLRDVPAIAREVVSRPIFVVALPRTATTFTREVLAAAQGHRGPLLWEMDRTDVELSEKRRCEAVKSVGRLYRSIGKSSPTYRSAFAHDPERPADCAHLLPHGDHHLMRAHMPAYAEWLDQRDFTPDYEYLRQALQVLQYGRPTCRWVLESPGHFDHLKTIHRVFPDATIVLVHRDPLTVLGSLCSLVETVMAMHVRRPDLRRIGETWMRLTARSIERARQARVAIPRESIVDVPYPLLVADPHSGAPQLFERVGAQWTSEDEVRLKVAMDGPGIRRSHEYELSRYGISSADAEAAFGDYPRTVQQMRMRLVAPQAPLTAT